jgi:hypothetical protein
MIGRLAPVRRRRSTRRADAAYGLHQDPWVRVRPGSVGTRGIASSRPSLDTCLALLTTILSIDRLVLLHKVVNIVPNLLAGQLDLEACLRVHTEFRGRASSEQNRAMASISFLVKLLIYFRSLKTSLRMSSRWLYPNPWAGFSALVRGSLVAGSARLRYLREYGAPRPSGALLPDACASPDRRASREARRTSPARSAAGGRRLDW